MRRSSSQGGYTLIEVLSAMAVLGSGLLGIVAMQTSAVAANQRASEVTMATNLARRWQDRLRRDSYSWTQPSQSNPATNIGATWYLSALGSSVTTDWIIPASPPASVSGLAESAAFDYFGNDVPTADARAFYCTHVRLTTLIPNELVRAEVRIWWFRQGGVRPSAYSDCARASINSISSDSTNVRTVYTAVSIQRHEGT